MSDTMVVVDRSKLEILCQEAGYDSWEKFETKIDSESWIDQKLREEDQLIQEYFRSH